MGASSGRPTRHHLAPTVLCQLSSLCAIWHALGKPSHDRPVALPRRSPATRCCAVAGELSVGSSEAPTRRRRRFLVMERRDGALPDLPRFAAAQSPKRIGQRSGRTHETSRHVSGRENRQPNERPQVVLATSIAAGPMEMECRWSNAIGFAGIALRGARHSTLNEKRSHAAATIQFDRTLSRQGRSRSREREMSDGREIIALVAKSQDCEQFRRKNWVGSFAEYLDIVREQPRSHPDRLSTALRHDLVVRSGRDRERSRETRPLPLLRRSRQRRPRRRVRPRRSAAPSGERA